MLAQPWLFLLGPVAVVLLYLLERWRRRPLRITVASIDLFQQTPATEAEAQARRRRLRWTWVLRALAALLFALAAADPRLPPGAGGPLRVDLVLDRGLGSGTREGEALRLDLHRQHLERILSRLRSDDRVRLHLVPGPAPAEQTPSEARAALAAVRATAARVDLVPLVSRLVAQRASGSGGQPPVFVATERPPLAPDDAVLLALSGTTQPSRGLVGLARGEEGALHATLASYGSPGSARVVLSARTWDGKTASREVQVELPARGLARVSWSPREGFPAGAREASARLVVGDALSSDDRAFAVLAPVRPRRVGVVGETDPDVARAVRAVPGSEVSLLEAVPPPAAQASLDLLVLPTLPRVLPQVATLVIPRELPPGVGRPLRLRGREHAAFRHTVRALDRELASVSRLAKLPQDLRSATPLILAGEREPFLVVRGRGRRLVAAARAPFDGTGCTWSLTQSFPLFWAELLELAAPRAAARLEAHVAGLPWKGAGLRESPWWVQRYRDREGRLLLGTVAARLDDRPLPPARPFPADALERLEAARPHERRMPLAPWLAVLALFLALASWWPRARGA